MATARRVIFSSYVIPSQSIEMEEESVRQTEFMASPGKTLGGSGIAEINNVQWQEGWTSMTHPQVLWEDYDDSSDIKGDRWEDSHQMWSGFLKVTTDAAQLTSDSSDLAFLYIRNLGDKYVLEVAINGNNDYFIFVPPLGSMCLRGDGSYLECNEVYVQAASVHTNIEYIIAKE